MPNNTPSNEPPPIWDQPWCVIYTRQSRTRSSEFSSCEAQRGICEEYAEALYWQFADERFDDPNESSESLDRPGLQRLFERLEYPGISYLLVYSVDRLTRRLTDLHTLLEAFDERGVKLRVVTDPCFDESAADRLMSNVVAIGSEFQQELTRERMSESRAILKKQGRRVAGRVPYGYVAEPGTKQLIPDPQRAEHVRQIYQLAAEGRRPKEIADWNNEQHWSPSETWTARRVLKVLSNPTYTGRIHNGDGVLPGRHEAIITQELFEQVRGRIESRRSRRPRRRTEPKFSWALQGLLKCGECGRGMSPSVSGHGNLRYRYYRCRSTAGGRPPCVGMSVSADEIEKFVLQQVIDGWANQESISEDARTDWLLCWQLLDDLDHRKVLGELVEEAIFDPTRGKVTVEISDDADQRLLKFGIREYGS